MAGDKTDTVYENLSKPGEHPWGDKAPPSGWGKHKYDPAYCRMAFDILSSDALVTKTHLCAFFQCSKPTIVHWIKTYPEFREAVECGLAVGEKIFRDKIAAHAFKSSKIVNNGLIKMMAANVYGIKEDISPLLVVNAPTQRSAEEEMIERGIPMPSFEVPDLGDEDEIMDGEKVGENEETTDTVNSPILEGEEEGACNPSEESPNPLKQEIRPLTERERAMLLENLKLKGQLKAKAELLEIQKGRGVKGFGSDFDSSDEKVVSPFGIKADRENRKNLPLDKHTGLSKFNSISLDEIYEI